MRKVARLTRRRSERTPRSLRSLGCSPLNDRSLGGRKNAIGGTNTITILNAPRMQAQQALIREARGSDAESITRVHLESSQDAYAPLAPEVPKPDGPAGVARGAMWR